MPIDMVCPHCDSEIRQIPDKFAGRAGKCPQCKEQVSIPKKIFAAPSKTRPHTFESGMAFWLSLFGRASGLVTFLGIVGYAIFITLKIPPGEPQTFPAQVVTMSVGIVAGFVLANLVNAILAAPACIIRLLIEIAEKRS